MRKARGKHRKHLRGNFIHTEKGSMEHNGDETDEIDEKQF